MSTMSSDLVQQTGPFGHDYLLSWSKWAHRDLGLAVLAITSLLAYAFCRCVYLLLFHPLAKYPGPKLAAVSNAYYAYLWFSGRYPWKIQALLKKYVANRLEGDAVRIAPNELVFCKPQAYHDIHGSAVQNREIFTKTNFQDMGVSKEPGIAAERDPHVHRDMSRKLVAAFSARAVHAQEAVVRGHVDEFMSQLAKKTMNGEDVDIGEWTDWLAWDLAGDLAYGRDFKHVKEAKTSIFLSTFLKVGPWGTLNQVTRKFPLLRPLIWLLIPPSIVMTMPALLRMNHQEVQGRIARRDNLDHPDYLQHLMPSRKSSEESPDGSQEIMHTMPSEEWLFAQADQMMAAGMDPLTNILTAAVCFLCRSPQSLHRLAGEVRDTFSRGTGISGEALQTCRYLQAVIDETMRLHTNAAFGLPRVSPGARVDGHYIEKGVVVQTAHYATTHDERFFHVPLEFHPERFLPDTHPLYEKTFARDDKSAYLPFSLGPRGCPGRNIALLQCRLFLAKLLWNFDMELSRPVEWEESLKLYAIYQRPEVRVKFTPVNR